VKAEEALSVTLAAVFRFEEDVLVCIRKGEEMKASEVPRKRNIEEA
jgi:hypothetical protein